MKNPIQVFNLKTMNYMSCLKIQKYLVRRYLENMNKSLDTLLLVEHTPVYTVGIRRSGYSSEYLDKLRLTGAQVEQTNRGGLITFHGPGQLVAYPILNLKNYKTSIKWYVSELEGVVIDLCKKEFNLNATRLCNVGYTGVWVNDAKIAAIGVHLKRSITFHGLALNCNVDLGWFDHIVPCGILDKKVSSLKMVTQNPKLNCDLVQPLFLKAFQNRFSTTELIMKNEKEVEDLKNDAHNADLANE